MEQPNLNYIEKISGGDKIFEQTLIDVIKMEFPTEKAMYFESIGEKNLKKTAEMVHKLKHKVSILGLEKGHEATSNFEHNLIDNTTKGQENFESILLVITKYLKTI
jgi:hypothetical protein